jgi:WXG100 family type VII secretion target
MTYIRYTPPNLAEASSRVLSTHNALQGDRDAMTAFLGKLRSDWHGGASLDYQAVHSEWNSSCDAIHQILYKLHLALDAAHANACMTESRCMRMWSGG